MTPESPFKHFLKTALGSLALIGLLSLPISGTAQSAAQRRHERAKRAQTAHDHHHHTGAKIVVGSAAGGAVVGGLLGGGKGALIGAGVGAGGGAIANKVRVDKGVHKREQQSPR